MAKNITEWRPRVLRNVNAPTFIIDEVVLDTLRDFCERAKVWTKRLTAIQIVAYTPSYAISSASGDIVEIDHARIGTWDIKPIAESWLNANVSDWQNATASRPERYLMGYDREIRLVYTPNESSDVYAAFTDLTFDASENTIESAGGGFTAAGLTSGQTIDISGTDDNDREVKATSVTDTVITVEGGLTDEGTADASATLAVNGLHVWAVLKPLITATTVEDFLYNDFLEDIANGARYRLFEMPGTKWANGEYAGYYKAKYEQAVNKAANRKLKGLTKANTGGIRG
ncbi:MAG TPA: hypothetical protein PLA18_16175 [Deltaproteobacteria bacterium]|nr:hypothetical protein [Deltaproteobacteria bacterium]